MKSNRDCKIVEDLLPNYIEGLTSEVTNYFIEEHIQSCEHCQEVLKAMQEQLNAEKVDGKEEIDYLKKINRKTKRTERIATISIILSVLLFLVVITFALPFQLWTTNDDGRINFIQQMFKPEEQAVQWTYYVAEKTIYDKEKALNGEYYNEIHIAQIDDNTEKIENYKFITIGVTKELLQEQLIRLKDMQSGDVKIIDNLQYNESSYSYNKITEIKNKSKDDIINILLMFDADGVIEKY